MLYFTYLHWSVQIRDRGGSRGSVHGVRTPPPPEMTCGFLIQLLFCQKKKTMWFIGVEVEQETSAPPPKKNPGSALERFLLLAIKIITRRYYSSRSLWCWGLHFNDRLTKNCWVISLFTSTIITALLDIKNIINYQVEKVQRKKGTMLAGQQ